MCVWDYADFIYRHTSAHYLNALDAAEHGAPSFTTNSKSLLRRYWFYADVGWSALCSHTNVPSSLRVNQEAKGFVLEVCSCSQFQGWYRFLGGNTKTSIHTRSLHCMESALNLLSCLNGCPVYTSDAIFRKPLSQ